MKQTNTLIRYILAAGCLCLALWSATWGLASFLTVGPAKTLAAQLKSNEPLNIHALSRASQLLTLSLKIRANSPEANLQQARTVELLAQQQPELITAAEQHYKQAIQQQPSWDFAWACYANFLSHSLKPAKEKESNHKNLLYALGSAILLGPYEKDTQEIMIPLVLKHWELLKESSYQQAAIDFLKKALAMGNIAKNLINKAAKYNQLDLIKPLTNKKWHHRRINQLKKEQSQ